MTRNQAVYGKLPWWLQVNKYYQIGETYNGHRWRLTYDDTTIADYDHEPTMTECMEDLIKWWTK